MNLHKFLNIVITLILGFSLFGVPDSSVSAQTSGSILTVTNANDSGPGSLRQAITDANSGYSIVFDRDFTIHLADSLTIDKDVNIYGSSEINGPPFHITLSGDTNGDGNGDVGVISVNSGVNVTLQNFTIADGFSDYGGGIANFGNLILDNMSFSNNLATDFGGAVYNTGNIGIWNNGFSNNKAHGDGGGIYNYGNITIWDSTFANNIAYREGGVIANFDALEIIRSTLYGSSAGFGAAIWNNGLLNIMNSTVASNTATQSGGALYNTGMVTITNTTISGNSAPIGAGIYTDGNVASTTLINTIVANNALGDNCSGTIMDGGNNLVWPDANCPGFKADPKLGILSWYGGPTWTVPLGQDSAAKDMGNDAVCDELPGAGSLDQRGVSRPQGLHCDIGAFEYEQPNHPPMITNFIAPVTPVQLGQGINATVEFSDPDTDDNHSVAWDWGDGSNTTDSATVPSVTVSHIYTSAGVYTVTATITDAASESDTATYQYVVIYDPDGGFVTGGGWINSPKGAYAPDSALTGKATFGFVSKYKKGATVPTGNTEFQFHVAALNFKSSSYDWLVIAGSKANYKGVGTINGMGEYSFMLSAIDGTPDKFRIKIWDKATDQVIYDNQIGEADDVDPVTTIEGGSILVHKEK